MYFPHMDRSLCRVGMVARIAVAVGIGACHTAGRPSEAPSVQPQGATGTTPAEQARSDIEHPRYTAAGVQFMFGMIQHHAQAVLMARWAPSHDAAPAIRLLCERIIISQIDEIKFMRGWLETRHQSVPMVDVQGDSMPGMDHGALMPGMLTPAQMSELDQTRGPAFDRLFLSDMIMHHRGAIEMVQQLMASGEANDEALSMYATNVAADQSAEIGRMQRMLAGTSSTPGAADVAH
jgi:uncharacterized protein (DUF305 family)